MAIHAAIAAFCIAFALTNAGLSTSYLLKGSVTCLDCNNRHDLSGIVVQVKCNKVKKLAITTTQKHGSFETELPTDTPTSSATSLDCEAKILGGPEQLYTSKKNMFSTIVRSHRSADSFTISEPLNFYTSCPITNKDHEKCCGALGLSKTIDFPVPREWGLAPSSYYVPFVPIIGIP